MLDLLFVSPIFLNSFLCVICHLQPFYENASSFLVLDKTWHINRGWCLLQKYKFYFGNSCNYKYDMQRLVLLWLTGM
jgi:hypothetical protein